VGWGNVDRPLFLEKRGFPKGVETFEIVVNEKPARVGIDPYFVLIDRHPRQREGVVTAVRNVGMPASGAPPIWLSNVPLQPDLCGRWTGIGDRRGRPPQKASMVLAVSRSIDAVGQRVIRPPARIR
jgi:hypothetical protein